MEKNNKEKILEQLMERTKKAKEELGWAAEKSLEDMCRDSWNYIAKQ